MGLALSDVVQASVSASSASPTVPGFGKTLFMAGKVPAGFPATPQTYTSLAGLITAGFLTTDDAYLFALAQFSANPAVPAIMVCQRTNKTVQVVKLRVLNATQGQVYAITLVTPLGVATPITYTVPAAQTLTQVATAILALINAVSGFSGSTSSVDTITIASPATAGQLNGFQNWSSNFYLTETTTDPGLGADLAIAIAGDNTWYGLEIDNHSKAEILAGATFCEANKKLFVTQSSESTVPDNAVSTDVGSSVQSAAYHYTAILYTGNNTKNFAAGEWQSGRFAGSPTPGNDTWMFNTLPGIFVDPLTETQSATLGNKFCTGYAAMQGVNITVSGGIANTNSAGRSGSGEFLDVRRFLDWLLSQIQLGIYQCLLGPGKTPFTDKGLQSLGNAVLGALQRGEQAQGLVVGSSQVAVPLASSVSSGDRQNRIVRGLNWSAQLAGAVHLVISAGTVTS